MYRYLLLAMLLVWAPFVLGAAGDCSGTHQVAARYAASNGELLTACFDLERQTVRITPANGSQVLLPAALSGSGARYSDGTRTFWEHQGVARYLVNDTLQFEGTLLPQAAIGAGH